MATTPIDGYISFAGGMDSSRSPSTLSPNQYVWSINTIIPKSSEGIATRKGFRPLKIIFESDKSKELWHSENPQGCGNYTTTKGEKILLYVISGYIFELRGNSFTKTARILNNGDRSDPIKKHIWITAIPGGAIINDGQDAPYYTNGFDSRRTRPSKREIGAGLMGVYVQNRFWYVKPDRKELWGSTILQPLSLDEAYIDNIYGFRVPEDDQNIQAIGKQGTLGLDAVGGNLAFATDRNFYSVDVRGARTSWGATTGGSTGFVTNTLPGMGAISGNSFESFNSNIFFRSSVFGLASLNQGRSEFANKDAFSKQTIEASLFFDNDTKVFLDSCYTKRYNKSIYTTIAPQHRNGFVYWNGLIVKTPDPSYGKLSQDNQYSDIVESIYTGLRPWNIQTQGDVEQEFYVLSYDFDCVNRLYIYDESLNYDIDYKGKQIPIEAQILTRSFDFEQPLLPKIGNTQFYSLYDIQKDTKIIVLSRANEYGEFKEQSKIEFKLSNKCDREGLLACDKTPELRDNILVSDDKTRNYFNRQDLFLITGSCALRRWIRTADVKSYDIVAYKQENEPQKDAQKSDSHKLFTYKISK